MLRWTSSLSRITPRLINAVCRTLAIQLVSTSFSESRRPPICTTATAPRIKTKVMIKAKNSADRGATLRFLRRIRASSFPGKCLTCQRGYRLKVENFKQVGAGGGREVGKTEV